MAITEDAAALARLRFEFRAGLGPPLEGEPAFIERCGRWMTERLASGSGWRCWVVECGGRIGGNAWLQILEKLPNPVGESESHGYISNLYLQPALRGSGLGNALLEACLTACDAIGVDAVILWPTPQSRSLYQRHGFAVRDDVMERR